MLFALPWQRPGDVVQKALAQLMGVTFRPFGASLNIYVTPVAFSLGWVAYAFSALMSIFGDRRLMPGPDTSILVLNCENGYVRDNNSWVPGRLIRDREGSVEIAAASAPLDASQNPRNVSLKIDIFVADPVGGNQGPTIRKA
jgi:hypothetical protein